MNILKSTCIILILAILSGCYSTGRQFVRPNFNSIENSKTTMKDIIETYGEPDSTTYTERNNKRIDRFQYAYYTSMGYAIGKGPVGRTASYYFVNAVLVGYLYTSNYPGDSTNFDIKKSKLIEEGKSTRKDVESIFGPPTGEAVYPLVDQQDGTEIIYAYIGREGVAGLGGIVRKNLTIRLSKKDIVENITQINERE